ncbi:CocE/NonD family hydrolase [Bdellovibrio sp. HCB288]|uniref:CocE/NonD family hydrolase n=1 Tax=Bdellovibrio sp. HCB288 TaxID=3394355 RepID=UPI0039B3A7B0
MQTKISRIAQRLTQQIKESPLVDYQNLFSSNLAAFYPKERVESILHKLFSEHGSFESLLQIEEKNGTTYFQIKFDDGSLSDLIIGLDEKGLIDRFFIGGSIPVAQTVLFEERVMRTRDEISLRTLVFQNNDRQPKAVILERSPYVHFIYGHTPVALIYQNVAKQFVEDGYAFILQALRGTGGSEGEFRFLHPIEIDDGYDAVMWASSQDFSTGNVGLIGGSYDGFAAIAASISNPPPLKVVVASSYFTDMADFGGLEGPIELFQLRWLDRVTRSQGTPAHFAPFSKERLKLIANVSDIRTYDQIIYGVTIPEWQRLANAGPSLANRYWSDRSIFNRLAEIKTPTFHIAGMNRDGNAIDTFKAFESIQQKSLYSDHHQLILGYWGHPATPQMYSVIQEMSKSWLAHYLLGHEMGDQPRIRFPASQDKNCEIFQDGQQFPLKQWSKNILYLNGSNLELTTPSVRTDYKISVGGQQSVDELLNEESLPEEDTRLLRLAKAFEDRVTIVGPLRIKVFVTLKSNQADLVFFLRRKSKESYATLGMSAIKILRSEQPSEVEVLMGPVFETFDAGDEVELVLTGSAFPTLARNTLVAENEYFDRFDTGEVSIVCSPHFASEISFFVWEQ